MPVIDLFQERLNQCRLARADLARQDNEAPAPPNPVDKLCQGLFMTGA
jgi:hypothetical protein